MSSFNIAPDIMIKMKLTSGKVTISKNDDPIMEIVQGEEAKLVEQAGNSTCIISIWISEGMVYCTEQILQKMTPFPIYPYTGTYVEETKEVNFRSIAMIKDVRQCMSEPQESYVKRTLTKRMLR